MNAGRTMIYAPDGHLNYWMIDCETGEVFQLPPRTSSVVRPEGLAAAICETHTLFYSPGGGATLEKIYSCAEGSIQRADLAPSADRVALLVHTVPENNRQRFTPPMLGNSLVVLDTSGREPSPSGQCAGLRLEPAGSANRGYPSAADTEKKYRDRNSATGLRQGGYNLAVGWFQPE